MKIYHPTPHIISTGRRFLWIIGAWLALGAWSVPTARAATDAANAAVLNTDLPPHITLAKASIAQVVDALHAAVLQHHDDAVDLLKIAVLAKTPKQGHGLIPCEDLAKLVQAAATAAPDKMSQLVDMAASLRPDCADSLQDALAGGDGALGGVGSGNGDGTGIGFPGSPGFVGSPPSGTVAIPPITLPSPSPAPVTSTTNN